MSRANLSLLILLAIAVISGWLAWLRPDGDISPIDRDGNPVPDYYLNGLTLTQFAKDGQQLRILKTVKAEHLPEAGTRLTEPRLTQFSPPGSPWQLASEHGHLDADSDILTLSGEVDISRLATPDNRPVQLRTRNLRYVQSKGYAETAEAVTVTSDRTRVTAVGLKAWLQAPGHIQLLSQVRAHYEP